MSQPLIYHLIDEFRVGGAQTHLITMLAEAQERHPYRHRVGCLFEDGQIAQSLSELGIPVDVFDFRSSFAARRFDRVVDQLRRTFVAHRPAVVEAHLSWSRILGLPAAALARVPHRVGFEHGDIYMATPALRAANFATQFAAHEVIVCSDALQRWVETTHHTQPQRLRMLHNCVDTKRFQPREAGTVPMAFHLPQGCLRLVTVGTLGRGVNKRVDISIRAVALAVGKGANLGLVVAGDGEQRAELEALASSLGVRDRVDFLGMRSDVPAVVASCDLFVHAAPFEPFGIVCLEAMACGLPVVVPDGGGIGEAVREGSTGLIYRTCDAEALAAAICRLEGDAALRERMGDAALKDVRERFTVEGYVDRLYATYGGSSS
jgi:glycosyltransferase involved in cell wall biosynthesis